MSIYPKLVVYFIKKLLLTGPISYNLDSILVGYCAQVKLIINNNLVPRPFKLRQKFPGQF